MLKKVLIVGALVAVVGVFFLGRDAVSYVSMGIDELRSSAKECIPIETQIKHAKGELAGLDPVIRECTQQKYRETVNVRKLEREIAAAETKLSKDRAEIGILKSHIENGDQYVTYGDRTYSEDEVLADLSRRFERFKVAEQTVKTKRDILVERQKALASMNEKLTAMETAKNQLALEIENLEARLAAVQVAQARSEFNLDDSELARVRQLVNEISTRIEVKAEVLDHEVDAYPEIPVGEPETGNVLEEINSYFDAGTSEIVIN
ncbi:MAG: hypothetical protein MPJ50_19065 [Pirellulales bacterium]|nr:hypothetical protein [Pirellulales bacterium]